MKLIRSILKSLLVRNCVLTMSLEPPKVKDCTTPLNREDFQKKISVPIIKYNEKNVMMSNFLKPLKKYLLKLPKFQPIRNGKIYLNPDLIMEFSQLPIKELVKEGIDEESFDYETVTLTYDNWNANELFKALLPDDVEPLTSYSKIGHIVHLNLRDEQLPYKFLIAEIYYDKTPGCKTVINKAEIIENTFRNFQIELLKGEANYQVEVKENGIAFEFDFSKVFWNPRLSCEHERLVKLLKPNDILYDVFAGVGPFSIPAGKRRVRVLANDLNPHSFKWLEHNVKKNKVSDFVRTFNKDGADFITEDVKNDLIKRIKEDPKEYSIHFAMNLPALASTFLHHFIGLLKDCENLQKLPTPICHCYCFVKGISMKSSIPHFTKKMYKLLQVMMIHKRWLFVSPRRVWASNSKRVKISKKFCL